MTEQVVLFNEIDTHIQQDIKPSSYFENLHNAIFETTHPFRMIFRLRNVKQSPLHHPEGSVWNHTLLVLDEAALRKDKATDRRVFMWAALLHDIGKIVTTKIRKGKITAYDHDKAGAKMTREFLAAFEQEPFISKVTALVRWHMQILYVAKDMRFTDLAAMRNETDIKDVALLGLCDRLGRLHANPIAEEQVIEAFLQKAIEKRR